jgi:hypothetical protein
MSPIVGWSEVRSLLWHPQQECYIPAFAASKGRQLGRYGCASTTAFGRAEAPFGAAVIGPTEVGPYRFVVVRWGRRLCPSVCWWTWEWDGFSGLGGGCR